MPHKADIYYSVSKSGDGEKPPVILIHGAGGIHLNWPPQMRRLPGLRVYALDLPGHGKSGGRSLQSISSYSKAVVNWFEELGLGRAIFVGHSMGSAIVMELALTYPHYVVGLSLIGSGARLRVHPDLLQETESETTFHRAAGTLIKWSFSPEAPEKLVDLARKRLLEVRSSVLHNDLLACDAFDVSDRVSEISEPTLIICGKEDAMTPVRYSQYLADIIQGSRLEIIPEAGHMAMLEKPEQVAGVLNNFVSDICLAGWS